MNTTDAWPVTRDEIAEASTLLAGRIRRTPVIDVALPGGRHATLKLELLQHTGSFKPRGAFVTALTSVPTPRRLVAASGGNHGLAVAYVARELGMSASIFVPETAPAAKIDRIVGLGAEVHRCGSTYTEALAASQVAAAHDEALAIHAYDGLGTITGQGTVGLELREQTPATRTVVGAVGGGGLLGGIACWYQNTVDLVAVEPEGCPTYARAVQEGAPTTINPGGLGSDALGASTIGDYAWQSLRASKARPVLVSEQDIAVAQAWLWNELRIVAEPGGAVALAAVIAGAGLVPHDGHVSVIVCGANTDPAAIA